MLTRIAGRDVAVPVRFGGERTPEHRLLLRFGHVEYDGSMQGHLLAEVRGELTVVRGAIVWDPVVRGFACGDRAGIDRLAECLDPVAAVLGPVGRRASGTVRFVWHALLNLLSPGFVLVGGLAGVVMGYLIYYALWITLAGWAFWHVIVPGASAAAACLVVLNMRLKRLHDGLFEAAHAALGTRT